MSSKSLEWKRKKKSDEECPPVLEGLLFGALFSLIFFAIGGNILNNLYGFSWTSQFYYFIMGLLPIDFSPSWFSYVFYSIIGGFFGMIIGALNSGK